MKFNLDQCKTRESGNNKEMKSVHDWLNNIQMGDDDTTKLLEKSYDSTITHAGLIYYFHYCWSNELGACLRPDMIWYTIINELAHDVLSDPELFRHLFSDSNEKKTIVQITGATTEFNIEQLLVQMKSIINNKDFLRSIIEPTFDSAPNNAKIAISYSFACMATPFFNYMTTLCGIPTLNVQGSESEWATLYRAIEKLKDYPPKGWKAQIFSEYFNRCMNTVNNIAFHTFGKAIDANIFKPLTKQDYYEKDNKKSSSSFKNSNEFFSDVFHYGPETHCGSGHDDVNLVFGWMKTFYKSCSGDLHKFKTHISYVPYQNMDTGRMFYKCGGMVYSNLEECTLYPQYGFTKMETTNKAFFQKLAKQDQQKEDVDEFMSSNKYKFARSQSQSQSQKDKTKIFDKKGYYAATGEFISL